MDLKKFMAILVCCFMVVTFTGCFAESGQSSAEATADPFGAYDEPITLTTIIHQTVTKAVPDGVTIKNNPWQTLWKSKGINVEYAAIAADNDDVKTKLNLAISSGDIPDYFNCTYATYKELYEADMLTDITDIFEKYASDGLKDLMYSDGGVMAGNVTEDGRLYGITQPADYLDYAGVVAIRTDWLEELGLDEPQMLDDIWDIAQAFKDNNMGGTCTIGIGATSQVSSGLMPMRYLINAYGAYTSAWIENNGELEMGIIQPAMKTALSKLHEKYAAGLLDQEYGTKTETNLYEDAVAGKSGVVFGNFTSPFYLDNGVKLGQEWGYFPLYAEDGSVAKAEQSTSFSTCVVVSKDCEHPEAVIKLYNMFVKNGTEEGDVYGANGINNLAYPTIIMTVGRNNLFHEQYVNYLATGEDPEVPAPSYDITKGQCEDFRLNGNEDESIMWYVYGPVGTEAVISNAIANDGYLMSLFTGAPGKMMQKYSANLGTLADQMITYIINGTKDIDYFDDFVEIWKSSGGDKVTAEVNEWYDASK